MRNSYRKIIRSVALTGLMAAMLECAKLAFAALPNIEIVTLLAALFGYCFGLCGVLAALIFVTIEPLIWGFGMWVISYYLYWPFVAVCFMLLRKFNLGGRVIPTALALILTAWFGILSSLVEVGLFSGAFDNFFLRFSVYYMRGIVFYIIQLVCNAVLFPILFPYFSRLFSELEKRLT